MFDGGSGYGTSLTGNDAMSLSGGFGGWVNSGIGMNLNYSAGMNNSMSNFNNNYGYGGNTTAGIIGGGIKSIGSQIGSQVAQNAAGSIAKGGLNGLMSNAKNLFKGVNVGQVAGVGLGAADALMGDKREYAGAKGEVARGADQVYDTAANAISMIPGWGTIAGLTMKGAGIANKALSKWTGAGTDGMTTTDALLGSNLLGGPLGNPIALINGLGGKKSHTMGLGSWQNQQDMNNVWNSYAGSQNLDNKANSEANKKYGLFSSGARRKANNEIDTANMNRASLLAMNQESELGRIRGDGMVTINNERYRNDTLGGINANDMRIGQNGLKLPTIRDIANIKKTINKLKLKVDKPKQFKVSDDIHDVTKIPNTLKEGGKIETKEWVPTFQSGGSVNVIPEGSLHARLHHMENADDLTKKGIPVVDNEGKQQAEIEKNEIIFRKEVTDKIEELAKDGSDDAAIECGKILTKEILENTEDRTGLIQEAKKGAKLEKLDNGAAILGNLNLGINSSTLNTNLNPNIIQGANQDIQNQTNKQVQNNMSKQQTMQNIVGVGAQMLDGLTNAKKTADANNAAKKLAQASLVKKQQEANDLADARNASIKAAGAQQATSAYGSVINGDAAAVDPAQQALLAQTPLEKQETDEDKLTALIQKLSSKQTIQTAEDGGVLDKISSKDLLNTILKNYNLVLKK